MYDKPPKNDPPSTAVEKRRGFLILILFTSHPTQCLNCDFTTFFNFCTTSQLATTVTNYPERDHAPFILFLLQFLNFLLIPLHLRTVFMGGCAFLWACFLCFSRQDGDGTVGLVANFVLEPSPRTSV